MFAVPGWSVSANNLTTEKLSDNLKEPGSSGKKRKRSGQASVNAANVGKLWETVVEGRVEEPIKKESTNKRQKKGDNSKDKTPKETSIADADTPAKSSNGNEQKSDKKVKSDKKKKNKNKIPGSSEQKDSNGSSAQELGRVAEELPAAPKLTPLQTAMRDKLISARFRHLNETLYTRPSEEAFSLFQDSPEMFSEYHEGFRQQVKVWPANPVDSFLGDIRTRAKIRQPHSKGKPGAHRPVSLNGTHLPRTAGTCTIADLGCGDAQLSKSLQADKAKLHLEIKSYDLQSPSPLVTKADIANLPLGDGDVNVAIFCLALMGTNWIDFIEEAYRILHWKGELWVAEIKSRFGPVRNKHAPVEHSVGHRRKTIKKGKAGGTDASAHNGEDLAVEVDGADDRRKETDVSAFVEALKRRGFVLNGEPSEAIDLSNKMFVKMRFIKGASPTAGKGVTEQAKDKGKKKAFAPRPGQEIEGNNLNESGILKPCVYKIR